MSAKKKKTASKKTGKKGAADSGGLHSRLEKLFSSSKKLDIARFERDSLTWIPTRSDLFNIYLGDSRDRLGIPVGRLIELYGSPDQGKTSLMTELMVAFQQVDGVVLFHDSDHKFSEERAKLRGWDPGKTYEVKGSNMNEIFEDFKDGVKLVRTDKKLQDNPILFAWDGAASTPIKGGETGMAAIARYVWSQVRELIGFCELNQVTLVVANPVINKIGGFGGRTTPMGGAFKFHSSLRLQVWRDANFTYTSSDPAPAGIIIGVKADKHAFKTSSDNKISLTYLFDQGFHNGYDLFRYLNAAGTMLPNGIPVVAAAGGRYSIANYDKDGVFDEDMKKPYSMYFRDLRTYLDENTQVVDYLRKIFFNAYESAPLLSMSAPRNYG